MASNSGVVSADNVAKPEFDELLAQYPALIGTISAAKGAKDGQKTLQELDAYRYGEALKVFGSTKPQREMTLDDVQELVEWKLRHGKFRPTLMKLVTSNDPALAKDIIHQALTTYRRNSDVQAALDILTKLKGIGPATASLLLTVHNPDEVIFFSDEAFYWLCCDGTKSPIKYNAKEYQTLRSRAKDLSKRLHVSATDIEKVAYVILKRTESSGELKNRAPAKVTAPAKSPAPPKGLKPKARPAPEKRKAESKPKAAEEQSDGAPLRRSKRTRT